MKVCNVCKIYFKVFVNLAHVLTIYLMVAIAMV